MLAEYVVEPAGLVTARLIYGNDPAMSIRWIPSAEISADGLPATWHCEIDLADGARWIQGCSYRPTLDSLDPELVYLANNAPQLAAAAERDEAYQAARRGVTFGVRASNPDENASWVSCLGLPGTRLGGCDVRKGDTECTASLPLLCLITDGELTRDPGASEGRWLAARIAASSPIRGTALATRDLADAHCARQFGTGWRVASWSDHGDGFIASGAMKRAERMWIDAPDNPGATCWAPR